MLHWNHLILAFPKIQKSCKNNMWELYDLVFHKCAPHHWTTCLFSFPILLSSLAIIWQIPRIILTHPSTSDEDEELLTQSLSRELPHDFDVADRHVCFKCFPSTLSTVPGYIHEQTQPVITQLFIFFDTEAFPGRISVKQTAGMCFFLLSLQSFSYVKFNCC